MRGLLADANCEGHVKALATIFHSEPWSEFWNSLNLSVVSFTELALSHQSSDRDVWQTCQREQLVLITINRNYKGSDSLEEMIRTESVADSLPVITIGNSERVSDGPRLRRTGGNRSS